MPGIIVGLMWSQYTYLIVDRNQGPLEALRTSRAIMRGNKVALFGIWLVTLLPVMFAAVAVAIASRGAAPWMVQLGSQLVVLVVMPWFYVLAAVCYLIVTGQPTADRAAGTPEGG